MNSPMQKTVIVHCTKTRKSHSNYNNVNRYLCVSVVTVSLRNENALFIEFALIIIYSYIQYKRILYSTYD